MYAQMCVMTRYRYSAPSVNHMIFTLMRDAQLCKLTIAVYNADNVSFGHNT